MKYVLGVDFGGGASKATLLDEKGSVRATATAEYPTQYGAGGKAEQNPSDWYSAACKNIRSVLKNVNAKDVVCICLDAATHTAVLLGEDGSPLCPSLYWTDTRCMREQEELEEKYGDEIFRRCKHRVDTIWTLPQLLYLKRTSPRLYGKVKRVMFAKDYVRSLFTGDFVTDYIEAQGSMLFDFSERVWDKELLSLAGLEEDRLPTVVSPLTVTGTVCARAAEDTGLDKNTKVICGSTDTVMEVFAAGGVKKGDATVKLATAGRICVVSDSYYPDKNIINYAHLKEGLYYPGSATKSCAASLRWFRDTFGGSFEELGNEAEKVPALSDGLMFHPYLTGELTPYANPELSGCFTGIRAEHTKAHFARAVMEGVAFSLLDCKRYLCGKCVAVGERACIIGGGAKSAVWRQIVADTLCMHLVQTEYNDSSFGSAMCAAVAAGFFPDLDAANKACRVVTGTVEPKKSNVLLYEHAFEKYRKIAAFLTELSHEK